MDWFLYHNGLCHERVNIRCEIWQRSLTTLALQCIFFNNFTGLITSMPGLVALNKE